MKTKWMRMSLELLRKLAEFGFRRFFQSVEPVKEKRDDHDTNR